MRPASSPSKKFSCKLLTHRPSQLFVPLVAVLLQVDLLPDGGPLLNQRMAEALNVLAQSVAPDLREAAAIAIAAGAAPSVV
mmetsp:Transcript_75057/g.189786  ORF Transcript_75057/g.189786 Transcript_75057/m.189786 type:complete len:81 (+) Transcript_75057:35-277(+)